MSDKAVRGFKNLNWFLLTNLLVVRFLRPIFSVFSVFSFKLWIDWLLLGAVVVSRRGALKPRASSIIMLSAALIVVLLNLLEHGVTLRGVLESINLILVLSVPLFYSVLRLKLPWDELLRHKRLVVTWLNIYFFVNIAVVLMQISGIFPIPSAFLQYNASVFDHFTGFIGMNGVATLNFVWIATIFGNLTMFLEQNSKRHGFLVILQIPLVVFVSGLNDNKMFFPVAFASLLTFVACSGRTFPRFTIPVILVGILSLPLAIDKVSQVFMSESGRGFDLLSTFLYSADVEPTPHNERAYINFLAFRYFDASETGVGLSNVDPTGGTIHEHLGINSATLLLIQGGLPLLIVGALLLFIGFRSIVRNAGAMSVCAIAVFSIILLYASNPIADRYTLIATAIFFFLIAPRDNSNCTSAVELTTSFSERTSARFK